VATKTGAAIRLVYTREGSRVVREFKQSSVVIGRSMSSIDLKDFERSMLHAPPRSKGTLSPCRVIAAMGQL
jgi:hypothetical protein